MLPKDFFVAGGLGMFPTALSGFLLVVAALLLALRPERRHLKLVVSLGLMTLGSGVLASLVGIVKTLHQASGLPSAQQAGAIFSGSGQALHCLVLALLIIQAALALAAVAALRAARKQAVE